MLTDEAFGYLVTACWQNPVMHTNRVWPDGLGGFTPESRESIANVQAAAAGVLNATPPGS